MIILNKTDIIKIYYHRLVTLTEHTLLRYFREEPRPLKYKLLFNLRNIINNNVKNLI